MYKLDLPVDYKEAAAIERRRNMEEQRKSRIFNSKTRTIGVSFICIQVTGSVGFAIFNILHDIHLSHLSCNLCHLCLIVRLASDGVKRYQIELCRHFPEAESKESTRPLVLTSKNLVKASGFSFFI